jgi:hypothetical protein
MNSDNFEKRLNEKVVPNLMTVIAMDSVPYHRKQVHKSLTKSAL